MHDTPPPPPIHQRDNDTLVEDLCIALRNVGVWDYELPQGAHVLSAIGIVQAIAHVLEARGVELSGRLAELSSQTGWPMVDLLKDCLTFPDTLPYVREADGIRRTLRCQLCRLAEHPPGAAQWKCDNCLRRIAGAIGTRTPIDGIILFRTYNAGARCAHADAETVLFTDTWTDDLRGQCQICIQEELARRGRSERPV